MGVRPVTRHVFQVSLTMVNVFLIVLPDGITMVDAGLPDSFPKIAKAITGLGRRPEEVTDIVVTHLHADHTGGLADAKRATGARVWMHPLDARLVGAGESRRPAVPAPGSVTGHLFRLFAGMTSGKVTPVAADRLVDDHQEIPVAGGMLPVFTPGHTAGHVAYLWARDGGVVFVGDAAARRRRLTVSPIYEDYEQGMESLRGLAGLDFQVACFSHGKPLTEDAAAVFAQTWGRP